MARSATTALGRFSARWWYLWGLSVCYSANVAGSKGLYKAGAWSFARAVALWPAFVQAHYQLGVICGRELGQISDAVAALDRASALRPDWPEPYLQRGLLRRFNGEPGAALADLRRYCELAPPGYWRDEAARQLAGLEGELGETARPML